MERDVSRLHRVRDDNVEIVDTFSEYASVFLWLSDCDYAFPTDTFSPERPGTPQNHGLILRHRPPRALQPRRGQDDLGQAKLFSHDDTYKKRRFLQKRGPSVHKTQLSEVAFGQRYGDLSCGAAQAWPAIKTRRAECGNPRRVNSGWQPGAAARLYSGTDQVLRCGFPAGNL